MFSVMGHVKMFEIVFLCCIILTKLIVVVDAYDADFENDHPSLLSQVLPGASNWEEKERTARNHPASDFLVHTRVTPKIYHGRDKRQISTTLEKNGKHTDHIEVTVNIDGAKLTLDLTLNRQLLPQGFLQKHQKNGDYETFRPNFQETNLCEYTGKLRGVPNSWVAISTCEGISGVIFDGNQLHYVEKGSSTESAHFLYSHSNLAMNNRSCGYGESDHHEHGHAINERIMRHKRFVNQSTVLREPYNANEESRYVELLLVMDNEVYKEHGESKSRTLNHAKNIANIINALYSRLNVFVALVGVVIWSEYDEITMTSDADHMLSRFLHYRREKLAQKHPNDNAQFITKQNFEQGIVAKALKGPICTFEYSGGLNVDYSPVVGLIATSVAHSLGHNFGMEHDTPDCKCPQDRCIMFSMSTPNSVAPIDWSSCSVNYLKQAFSHGMDYCLKNIPKWLIDGPVCGNGFLEEGEQCDCGLPQNCNNPCCNAETCTMRSNVTCAHGRCCDMETCSLKEAGTLCRSAISECDLEEYCSGYSEICPVDYHKLDAGVCGGGKAYCYQGFCKSRTDQCKLLWGETANSSEIECYQLNTRGSRYGHCGYNMLTRSYIKCEEGNQLCGMVQCKHRNDRLEFGMESVATLSLKYIYTRGNAIECKGAVVDLGLDQVDPGLTPNGAPCGEGKMCVDQKCISVSGLRNQGPSCPRDCNGNGWCNNKGNCHCKDGFAPPYCDFPGPGGSLDSGPASNPKALWKNFSKAPSSSTISNTTKHLIVTPTPVDVSAMQSDDPNTPKHFNDSVTNLNDTGTKSDRNTDLNNADKILNNTYMNFENTAVTSDTLPPQPEDTTSSLNDNTTNTTKNFNDTGANLNDTGTKSKRNTDLNNAAKILNKAAKILNNASMDFENTAVTSEILPSQTEDITSSSNDTTTNLNTSSNLNYSSTTSDATTMHPNDTNLHSNNTNIDLNNVVAISEAPALTSDASVTTRIPFFPLKYVQIVIAIVFFNM